MSNTPNIPIFDGHNDTILRLHENEDAPSFFVRSDIGHIDLPRAIEGGLGGGFFALFTPSQEPMDGFPGVDDSEGDSGYDLPLPAPLSLAYAQQYTLAMTARLLRLEREAEGRVKIIRTADEYAAMLKAGVFAMIFHIEGAEAIDTNLDMLYVLYEAGLRSVGITWSRPNAFAHGVPFKFPSSPDTGPGLTDAGKTLVRACNELGILIDLSHLNEKGFWDVASLTDAPLVATHSGAHVLCASARNLTDAQLDAIRQSDGMVGVNFHIGFLREDGRTDLETSVNEIARHVDYMVERMGIEHVGFGSDFDGAKMPQDLGNVAGLPKLLDTLRTRGYDDSALHKIAHENWHRILQKTWK